MPTLPWKSCRVSWHVHVTGWKNLSVATKRFHSLLRPKSGPEAAWRQVPSTEPREVGIRSGAGCRAFEERRPENTGRARRGLRGVVENHRDDTSMYIHEKILGKKLSLYMLLILKRRE